MMRKIMAVLASGLLVASVLGAPAVAQKGKGKQQKVEGHIYFPAPFLDDSGCYAGLHRRGIILTGGVNQGLIGYHFDVEKATWNKPFVLEPSDGFGSVDMDIYFYLGDYGTTEDVINDPGGAGAPPSVSYNTREPGGEADIVPKEAQHVIICIYGGQQGGGGDADFTYTAGGGVELPKE